MITLDEGKNAFRERLKTYGRGEAAVIEAMAVYTVNLRDLAAGDLSQARQIGVESFATLNGVNVGGIGGTDQISMEEGPLVDNLWVAYKRCRSTISGEDYELRILRLPSLPLEAVWAHTPSDSTDLIMPFFSPGRAVELLRLYSETDFLMAVGPVARRKQAQPIPRL